MINLFVFIVATYGMTNIIVAGKIFAGIRGWLDSGQNQISKQLSNLINCYMCMGFWAGIFWYVLGIFPSINLNCPSKIVYWLLAGCIGSAGCWATRVILSKLGEDNL